MLEVEQGQGKAQAFVPSWVAEEAQSSAAVASGTHAYKADIVRHLASLAPLTEVERDLVIDTLGPAVRRTADQELIAPDASLDDPIFIVSGWACRATRLADGRRQILDFYLPGELAGFAWHPGARAEAAYTCLTGVVASSARDMIARVRLDPGRYSGLCAALVVIEREMEQGLLKQIVRLGRMQAVERMVDLMADLYVRLHRVGLADGFLMPLSQDVLGDALGLSAVHINRSLQQLKHAHLIKTRARQIEVQNPTTLTERARALLSGRLTSSGT